MYERLVKYIKSKLGRGADIKTTPGKSAVGQYLDRISFKLANVVGVLKTAAIFLTFAFLTLSVLLALWLGDSGARAEAVVIICVMVIALFFFKSYKRRSAPRAYNVFVVMSHNSEDYGCAIPCRRNIFDVNKAYCPLNSIELKRIHGYDETIVLNGVFLALELAQGSPRVRVDILRAILGSRDTFRQLPDRLSFEFKTEAGGDAAAVKRIRAKLECDEVYDITYNGHRLRVMIYSDVSKQTLLSKGGFIM